MSDAGTLEANGQELNIGGKKMSDYFGKEVTIICVMRGAVFFAVELTLKMKTKLKYELFQGEGISGVFTILYKKRK